MARMPSISATRSGSAVACGRLHALNRTSAAATTAQDFLASGRLRERVRRRVVDLIEFGDFGSTADDERCTLMNRLGVDIHDPGCSTGRLSSRLLGDKG